MTTYSTSRHYTCVNKCSANWKGLCPLSNHCTLDHRSLAVKTESDFLKKKPGIETSHLQTASSAACNVLYCHSLPRLCEVIVPPYVRLDLKCQGSYMMTQNHHIFLLTYHDSMRKEKCVKRKTPCNLRLFKCYYSWFSMIRDYIKGYREVTGS